MPTPTVFGRPGVYTTESLIGPNPAPPTNSPSVAAFQGEHWRGPTNLAVLVTSWPQFQAIYGGFNTTGTPVLTNPYLAYAVYMFFQNGGSACYVSRIVSSSSSGANASLTLNDSQATPVATLVLTVGRYGVTGSPGTWGNQLYATVTNRGGAGSGRFDLTLYYGGTSLQYVVEQWIDLSMNPSDSRFVFTILNSAVQGSQYVVASYPGGTADPAVSPANTPVGITAGNAGTQFTGGTDPSQAPSNSDKINALTYNAGTAPLDNASGMINLNLPGETTASVITAAIAYAGARPSTFLVVDTPSGQTAAGAISYAQTLAPPYSAFAAVYYPWLNASDPSNPNVQATKLLPPGGFVLGQYAANDTTTGPWKSPAGLTTALGGVVSAERMLGSSDLDSLNLANVNAIRSLPNGQVVIWGVRTQQTSYVTQYVGPRRMLNYLESNIRQILLPFVFQDNDSILWATISNTLTSFLSALYGQSAFPGNQQSDAFYVVCDATNNTPQTIAQGKVMVTVGVALETPAEFIVVNIAQFQNSGASSTSIVGA